MSNWGLPADLIPTLDEITAPNVDRLDTVDWGSRRPVPRTTWHVDTITTNCFHIGHGIWRTKCSADGCAKFVDSIGAVPRHSTIGRHEEEAHGMSVAGLSAGLLPA